MPAGRAGDRTCPDMPPGRKTLASVGLGESQSADQELARMNLMA